MRRRAGLVLTLALLITGSAAARPAGVLRGTVEPAGSVSVKLSLSERQGVKLRGYRVAFRDVPLQCVGGSTQTTNLYSSKVVYRRNTRHFAAAVATLGTDGIQGFWSYEGRLVGRDLARGTIKFRDRAFAIGEGQTDDCSSGELRWSASRE
jgi:hypothetical protein